MDKSTPCTEHQRVHEDMEEVLGANNFRILTSFRLDVFGDTAETKLKLCDEDQPFPFSYHRDRLLQAAVAFRWQHVVDRLSGNAGMELLVNRVISGLSTHKLSSASFDALKIRLMVSKECEIWFDCNQLQLVHPESSMRLSKEILAEPRVPGSC